MNRREPSQAKPRREREGDIFQAKSPISLLFCPSHHVFLLLEEPGKDTNERVSV